MWDRLDALADACFALCCCLPGEGLHALVSGMVVSQQDDEKRVRERSFSLASGNTALLHECFALNPAHS